MKAKITTKEFFNEMWNEFLKEKKINSAGFETLSEKEQKELLEEFKSIPEVLKLRQGICILADKNFSNFSLIELMTIVAIAGAKPAEAIMSDVEYANNLGNYPEVDIAPELDVSIIATFPKDLQAKKELLKDFSVKVQIVGKDNDYYNDLNRKIILLDQEIKAQENKNMGNAPDNDNNIEPEPAKKLGLKKGVFFAVVGISVALYFILK